MTIGGALSLKCQSITPDVANPIDKTHAPGEIGFLREIHVGLRRRFQDGTDVNSLKAIAGIN
jgi:hypothetical protein